MMKPIYALILLLLPPLYACSQTLDDLNHQIQQCQTVFNSGTPEAFQQLFPGEEQAALIKEVTRKHIPHKAGQYRILAATKDSALVLLTGLFTFGNTGDETFSAASYYSGVYVFKPVNNNWVNTGRIAIDRLNQLKQHDIVAHVQPEQQLLSVEDRLVIDTHEQYGFVMTLNHHAVIKKVQVNKKNADYVFDGGLLWINTKKGANQQVNLSYSIQVDTGQDRNSGYFGKDLGHVRNQYFWHPFFHFSSTNDKSMFTVKLLIPAGYHLATSLPQTDTVINDTRIITAHSAYPTSSLSMYYDKDWVLHRYKKGNYLLEVYCTDAFKPSPDTLSEIFAGASNILSEKFGNPAGNYLCVIQDRSNGGDGWKNRSNDMIVAAAQGSYIITAKPMPRAIFGHEVAHAWTKPYGRATNFLSEGWASFAESYLLQKEYGDTILPLYRAAYANIYFKEGFDGTASLWEDAGNGGVSYYKGLWLLYMLQEQLGKAVFEKGLKAFMQSGKPMTIELLSAKLSEASGQNIWPVLEPWLKSRQVPHVKAVLERNGITITQEGDVFRFPLEIRFLLKNGKTVVQRFTIEKAQQHFDFTGFNADAVDSFTIDPGKKLLIKTVS